MKHCSLMGVLCSLRTVKQVKKEHFIKANQSDPSNVAVTSQVSVPVLVQRPAVQLPGQLCVELRLLSVLHRVREQVLAIEAHLDHQAEPRDLGKVAPWRRADDLISINPSFFLNDYNRPFFCL